MERSRHALPTGIVFHCKLLACCYKWTLIPLGANFLTVCSFSVFFLELFFHQNFLKYIYIKGPFSCSFLFLQAKVMAEVRDREHSRQLKSLLDQNFLVSFWSSEAHNSE